MLRVKKFAMSYSGFGHYRRNWLQKYILILGLASEEVSTN